jgi:hypothetical protein
MRRGLARSHRSGPPPAAVVAVLGREATTGSVGVSLGDAAAAAGAVLGCHGAPNAAGVAAAVVEDLPAVGAGRQSVPPPFVERRQGQRQHGGLGRRLRRSECDRGFVRRLAQPHQPSALDQRLQGRLAAPAQAPHATGRAGWRGRRCRPGPRVGERRAARASSAGVADQVGEQVDGHPRVVGHLRGVQEGAYLLQLPGLAMLALTASVLVNQVVGALRLGSLL